MVAAEFSHDHAHHQGALGQLRLAIVRQATETTDLVPVRQKAPTKPLTRLELPKIQNYPSRLHSDYYLHTASAIVVAPVAHAMARRMSHTSRPRFHLAATS